MKRMSAGLFIGSCLCLAPLAVAAAPSSVTYTYEHHIISVSVAAHPEWKQARTVWTYRGVPAVPPSRLLSCGEEELAEAGWASRIETGWNEDAIAETIRTEVASRLDRSAGSVVIRKLLTGAIVFEGRGLTGRSVNIPLAAALTKTALETDTATVLLPMTETQPQITVEDEELRNMGIKEVVMTGESVFAGSPINRRHNIAVGVNKFNGHLIPKDSVFSFVEVLGPVNDRTGYRKELVIQGAETLPDYGGGLCQVSSTAYRGPWEYGLPIVQRKNHSYAVSYYSPQGTDATIYPPNVDMKFLNDTPGALLIQSFTDEKDRAFFVYYGTRDDRKTEVFGPYITDRVAAPREEKISYTTEIPPGEKRKAGERHDGMNVLWYRSVQKAGTGALTERFFSHYQARPLYWQLGVTADEMARLTGAARNETPSWLPSSEDKNDPSSAER
jgi:hypothetical protein